MLLKLYKAPFPTGKKPGRSCCAAKPPENAACSVILLRRGRKFLPVPCARPTSHPSLRHGRIFLPAFCSHLTKLPCQGKKPAQEKVTSTKKILLRCGRNFCLCPAHALQAIPHRRKEAGKRGLCSQAPVGISLVGLACHNLCPYLQAPPSWSKGPVAFWMRRRASGFNPGLPRICRGSNSPSRGCLHFSFCLGSCRAFKGQGKKRTLRSSLGAGPTAGLPLPRAPFPQKDRDGWLVSITVVCMCILFGGLSSILTVPLPMFG